MDAFTIKDVENLTGIKAHTIRIWEQRYSFLNPQRTDTNIRYYSARELQTMLSIALLNKFGYKISHIDRMTPAEINDRIAALTSEEAQHQRIVNELLEHMFAMRINDFEKITDRCIQRKGVERTILDILFPFLDRIGILWLSQHIEPAQEHLVSNIIRQKIILGIENLPVPSGRKSAVLFLPEGEFHELGLLYVQFMLKRNGVATWYLGTDTPLADIVYTACHVKPDFVYLHLTAPAGNFHLEKYLTSLRKQVSCPVVISGAFTGTYTKKAPQGVNIYHSLEAVNAFINSL